MTAGHETSSTGAAVLLPCPLCQSANIAEGVCYVEFKPNEPAVRCCDCGCRATLKAWQSRRPAQQQPEPFIEDYKRDTMAGLIEQCAKIAEPWPGFNVGQKLTEPDISVIAVRTEIAAKIRALAFPSTSSAPPQPAPDALREALNEYVRDLRRNSSGGDDYPWSILRGVADYLETLIERASTVASHDGGAPDA